METAQHTNMIHPLTQYREDLKKSGRHWCLAGSRRLLLRRTPSPFHILLATPSECQGGGRLRGPGADLRAS